MLISNEYALIYYPNQNQIVITLPQTWKTQTNTFSPVIDRRTDVKETELMPVLQVAQVIFHKEERKEIADCFERDRVRHGHWIFVDDDLLYNYGTPVDESENNKVNKTE